MQGKYYDPKMQRFSLFQKDSNKNVSMHNIFLCVSFLVSCITKKEMKLETITNFDKRNRKKKILQYQYQTKKKITPTKFFYSHF